MMTASDLVTRTENAPMRHLVSSIAHRRRRRFAVILAFLIGSLPFATASPATAHDSLVMSTPAEGAVVDGGLERISLTFTEPSLGIEGTSLIRVVAPDGTTVSDAPATADGATVSVRVRFAEAGLYRVTWQNVSSDGHVISGEYAFTWNQTAATVPQQPKQTTPASPAIPSSASPQPGSEDSAEGLPVGWVIGVGATLLAALAAAIFLVSKPRHPLQAGIPVGRFVKVAVRRGAGRKNSCAPQQPHLSQEPQNHASEDTVMSRPAPVAAASQKIEHIRTFRLIGLVVLVIVGVTMAVIATVQGAESSSNPASSRTSASAVSGEFTAQTTDGEQIPVPGTKPSVLFFFSIECGVCGPATKMLAQMQRSAPEAANYVVVDVANYETALEVESFLAEYEAASLGYTIDTDARLITAYQVSQLSTVVVLDASGGILFSGVEPSEAQIRVALLQAGVE